MRFYLLDKIDRLNIVVISIPQGPTYISIDNNIDVETLLV